MISPRSLNLFPSTKSVDLNPFRSLEASYDVPSGKEAECLLWEKHILQCSQSSVGFELPLGTDVRVGCYWKWLHADFF